MATIKVPRICEQCGQPFKAYPRAIALGHGRFCGMRCQRDSRMTGKVPLVCANCGKDFSVYPSVIKWKGVPDCCSVRCRSQYKVIPLAVRFQRYVGPTTETGCILWIGATDEGYGIINSGPPENKRLNAPTVALQLAGIVVPKGYGALHHCDNPPCINVEHLFVGTSIDNARDRDEKGRVAHGESHGFAKLTEAIVLEARQRYTQGEGDYKQLAYYYSKQLGTTIHPVTMGDAIAGRTWKHL